jgi:5-formyltetrahydrofolate cyclo-ligase
MGSVSERARDADPNAVAKANLRAELKAKRRTETVGRDRVEDAQALALDALRVAHEAGLGRGSWVAAFESTASEPPTEALVDALQGRGIRVMVPITREDWDLDWREAGTDAPLGVEAVAQAKVVFVPAQAVDLHGHRLGRGKGCYDRALPRTAALLVAVLHPWEVLDGPVPHEPHDRTVHAVIAAGLGFRRLDA